MIIGQGLYSEAITFGDKVSLRDLESRMLCDWIDLAAIPQQANQYALDSNIMGTSSTMNMAPVP